MKQSFLPIAFAAGVSAIAVKRDVCFTLNTSLGYISTSPFGQNTIGVSPNGPTQYCMSANTLSVQRGPECLIDDSTNQQFQCTDFNGIVSKSKFSIADNHDLLYDDCPKFYACPVDVAHSSWKILADGATDTSDCTPVHIQIAGFSVTGLGGSSNSSSSAPGPTGTTTSVPLSTAPVTVTSIVSSTSTSGVTCPTDLSKGAIAPNLFVHVESDNVDFASGPSPNITVETNISSLLAFDVPVSYTDTCALLFMFPYSSKLNASDALNPYLFSGTEKEEGDNGGLIFSLLDGVIHNSTTYATKPPVKESYNKTEIVPGNSYTISKFVCNWGEQAYQIDSVGDVSLIYDQDADPGAIGLFIVHCDGSSA